MTKKTISASLPERLVDAIDTISENRSNFVARAVVKMLKEPDLIDQEIERQKQEKKKLMEKKHELEMEIEQKRETVNDLENLKTEARTLQRVKSEIPEGKLQQVRDTVRVNKYDSDPRSADPEEVIQHNADRLSGEYGVEKEEVVQVLRITTDL